MTNDDRGRAWILINLSHNALSSMEREPAYCCGTVSWGLPPVEYSAMSRACLVICALHNIVLRDLRVILDVICNHILFKILLLLHSNCTDIDWYCSFCSLRDNSGRMVVCKSCKLNWKTQAAHLTMQVTSYRYIWLPCNTHTLTGSKAQWIF